jgi:hypothetical protein
VTLKSDAAAEEPKDQLSRDFLSCSIFDFCNNIGTYRTCPAKLTMSVNRSKADLALGRIGAFTFAPLVSPSVMRGKLLTSEQALEQAKVFASS